MASPPKSEEEWDALWDEMNKLWSRYDKARFYGNMLLEVVRFLDEHDAGRKDDE